MRRLLISIFLIMTMGIPARAVKYIINNTEGACEWTSKPDSSTGEIRNFKNLKVYFEWCAGRDQIITSYCLHLPSGTGKEAITDMPIPKRHKNLTFAIKVTIEEWINGNRKATLRNLITDVFRPSDDADTINVFIKKIEVTSRFKKLHFDHTVDATHPEEAKKQLLKRSSSDHDED